MSMQETEIKLRLSDPARLRQRLARLGATCEGSEFETNRIFDTPDQRRRRTRPLERQHVARPPAALVAPHEEVETNFESAAKLSHILARLGFVETVLYEKRRETWRMAACDVTIDELPRLGWFVEIEGPTPTQVLATRDRLELGAAAVEPKSYVALAAEFGEREAGGGAALRFDAGATN
jgi:adenylate cyclase, class 2